VQCCGHDRQPADRCGGHHPPGVTRLP
jgi:hypothetical protein